MIWKNKSKSYLILFWGYKKVINTYKFTFNIYFKTFDPFCTWSREATLCNITLCSCHIMILGPDLSKIYRKWWLEGETGLDRISNTRSNIIIKIYCNWVPPLLRPGNERWTARYSIFVLTSTTNTIFMVGYVMLLCLLGTGDWRSSCNWQSRLWREGEGER